MFSLEILNNMKDIKQTSQTFTMISHRRGSETGKRFCTSSMSRTALVQLVKQYNFLSLVKFIKRKVLLV